MEAASGRPTGFDYMRIILSLLVLLTHALQNGGGKDLTQKIFWGIPGIDASVLSILPMFFALSGFLVAGSLYRCKTLISFLGLRFIRIYPALAVEVLLTAFLLGPIVTTLPVREYFTSEGFLRYVMNVTGHTTVYLPGAFSENPQPHIANGQLWTVPWELMCYIALCLAAMLGGKRSRIVLISAFALVFAAAALQHGYRSDWKFSPYEGVLAGRLLVVAFMAGVVFYAYREYVPVSVPYVMAAAIVAGLLFSFTFLGQYLAVILISYVTCALGVMNPKRINLLRHADLSYGVFLYHFIIQQTLLFFFPPLQTWYWCLIASLPLSIAIAAASWYLVELPAMRRKRVVFAAEERWIRSAGSFRRRRVS